MASNIGPSSHVSLRLFDTPGRKSRGGRGGGGGGGGLAGRGKGKDRMT